MAALAPLSFRGPEPITLPPSERPRSTFKMLLRVESRILDSAAKCRPVRVSTRPLKCAAATAPLRGPRRSRPLNRARLTHSSHSPPADSRSECRTLRRLLRHDPPRVRHLMLKDAPHIANQGDNLVRQLQRRAHARSDRMAARGGSPRAGRDTILTASPVTRWARPRRRTRGAMAHCNWAAGEAQQRSRVSGEAQVASR